MIFRTHATATSGFTLVEVMAVIAIIGILASVVVANMANVRANARDKFVMATVQSMIIEAALFRANNATGYTGLCADARIQTLRDDINSATNLGTLCDANAAGFEIQAPLLNGTRYCIDQTKFFGATPNAVVADHDC